MKQGVRNAYDMGRRRRPEKPEKTSEKEAEDFLPIKLTKEQSPTENNHSTISQGKLRVMKKNTTRPDEKRGWGGGN